MKELFLTLHFSNKTLGRFEAGEVVSGDHDGRVLANVAGSLFSAMLHNKRTEATQIDIFFFFQHTVFY